MKNRVQWIVVFGIFSIAFTFSRCRKNETPKTNYHIVDSLPGNALNPYDSFGIWHNLILDSLKKQRSARSGYRFSSSCDYIRNFYRKKNWPELSRDHFDEIPQVVTGAATDASQFIRQSKWSDSVKARLHSLIEKINQLQTDSCSYPTLKKAVSLFEADVLQSNLSATDKEVVLKVSSIARHSGYRWMQEPNGKEPFYPTQLQILHRANGINNIDLLSKHRIDSNMRFFEKIGKWFAVTACDMGGAIADLSVASGAAASDYMSELFKMH